MQVLARDRLTVARVCVADRMRQYVSVESTRRKLEKAFNQRCMKENTEVIASSRAVPIR